MKLLLIGIPENRRCRMFLDAWRGHFGAQSEVLLSDWDEVLRSPEAISDLLGESDLVRLESPGEDWEIEKALLSLGAARAKRERRRFEWLPAEKVGALPFEHGRIRFLRQWYHGWSLVLEQLGAEIERVGAKVLGAPASVALLFDKARCHEHCLRAGLPRPAVLGSDARDFDEVMDWMAEQGCRRVFLKPRHGSSASGVVALQRGRNEITATAAIERQGEFYFNSLKVRSYRALSEIRALINFLCRQAVIVERWFPKCGFDGATVDLRVVTTAGEPTHFVLRSSQGPLTNLHLGNRRGNLGAFRRAMGTGWELVREVCRATARAFPEMFHLGIDLMVSPSGEKVAIAEINAFGDLLPGIIDEEGRSTYGAQVAALAALVPATGQGHG